MNKDLRNFCTLFVQVTTPVLSKRNKHKNHSSETSGSVRHILSERSPANRKYEIGCNRCGRRCGIKDLTRKSSLCTTAAFKWIAGCGKRARKASEKQFRQRENWIYTPEVWSYVCWSMEFLHPEFKFARGRLHIKAYSKRKYNRKL